MPAVLIPFEDETGHGICIGRNGNVLAIKLNNYIPSLMPFQGDINQ